MLDLPFPLASVPVAAGDVNVMSSTSTAPLTPLTVSAGPPAVGATFAVVPVAYCQFPPAHVSAPYRLTGTLTVTCSLYVPSHTYTRVRPPRCASPCVIVAYGDDGLPLPVESDPVVLDTNTPYVDVRMHGSVVTDGSSAFESHAPLHA
jgi:hypothetical protein